MRSLLPSFQLRILNANVTILPLRSTPFFRSEPPRSSIRILLTTRFSTSTPPPPRVSARGVEMANDQPNCSLSLAKRLWKSSGRDAAFAQFSPFVVCLASGTLETEVFRHYIAQDKHFLEAFADAYQKVEECVGDEDAKSVVSKLRTAVFDELKMHDSVAKGWGIDMTKEINPNSATVKYIDFLQMIAKGKIDGVKLPSEMGTSSDRNFPKMAAYTIAAMTPCMRLYAFLGQELMAFLESDTSAHPYKEWIDNYSSICFEASALQIEDLLDKLSSSLTVEELKIVGDLYNQAMKLEIEFFYDQPILQQTVVPLIRFHDPLQNGLVIFSDFDLTSTVVDSCAILAKLAISTVGNNIADQQNAPKSDALWSLWNGLSSLYTEEFEHWMEGVLTSEEAKEYDYEGLLEELQKLSDFEKLANRRVIESGLFKGLKFDDIKQAGESMVLQNGCMDFMKEIVKEEKLNADLHIISVCWCGDFIRAALAKDGLDLPKIHSNEFCYKDSISTGDIVFKLESPVDKIQTVRKILNSKNSSKNLSVYIGDSLGDLLCLLEADVGIVIVSSSSLRKVGARFGVTFEPLFHGLVKQQSQLSETGQCVWRGQVGTLYTVSSWAEIHAFFLVFDHLKATN